MEHKGPLYLPALLKGRAAEAEGNVDTPRAQERPGGVFGLLPDELSLHVSA